MRYTIIRLDTLEMKVAEEVTAEEVKCYREGAVAIVDMGTGLELSIDEVRVARSSEPMPMKRAA